MLVSKRWKILIYFILSDLSCSIYFGIFAIAMKRIVIVFSLLLSCAVCVAQVKIKDAKALPLKAELVADFADWTPDSVKIKGSTQGLAMYKNYAVVLHDGGMCCIFDIKKKALIAAYMLEGNTSHCNNAFFGKEKYSKDSKFPLLYVSECRGGHACLVTDITDKGGKIVQKIYYEGTDYPGSIDWCADVKNGFIYTFGGRNGDFKLLKKFRMPKLSDSDEKGEVRLKDSDVLDVTRIDSGINIWQGSFVLGDYAFLPDGYAPHDRLLHIVNMKTKKIERTENINALVDEPEGIDIHGRYVYVVFHTSREPRHSKLWRFTLR